MDDAELLDEIASLKSVMVAVSTGGPAIKAVDAEYQEQWRAVDAELTQRRLQNPNPHRSLWDWYGRWSDGTLPQWRDRRAHIRELFLTLEESIRARPERRHDDDPEPTGWGLVDRQIDRMRGLLAAAKTAEDFQAVGLLGREVLISLAQAVFSADDHETDDGTVPSNTDARRMLEAYVRDELPGGGNEELRKAVRSVIQAALALQHDRSATYVRAALCYEMTVACVNSISKIHEGSSPTGV